MTLLKDLIIFLGVALLEVFRQFNRNATLFEDLQIVVKPTLLRDFLKITSTMVESNNDMIFDATKLLITDLNSSLYTWSFLI